MGISIIHVRTIDLYNKKLFILKSWSYPDNEGTTLAAAQPPARPPFSLFQKLDFSFGKPGSLKICRTQMQWSFMGPRGGLQTPSHSNVFTLWEFS